MVKKKLDKETWYAKFMHFADIVICIASDKLHLILFVTKDFFFAYHWTLTYTKETKNLNFVTDPCY